LSAAVHTIEEGRKKREEGKGKIETSNSTVCLKNVNIITILSKKN
jgi:hypothetical protein